MNVICDFHAPSFYNLFCQVYLYLTHDKCIHLYLQLKCSNFFNGILPFLVILTMMCLCNIKKEDFLFAFGKYNNKGSPQKLFLPVGTILKAHGSS